MIERFTILQINENDGKSAGIGFRPSFIWLFEFSMDISRRYDIRYDQIVDKSELNYQRYGPINKKTQKRNGLKAKYYVNTNVFSLILEILIITHHKCYLL